ncbi:MAG TPA: radical SAM protein [Longimicrobiales bacterium]
MPNRRRPERASLDFDRPQFLVIWEVARACDLACTHCRAAAVKHRHPLEPSTEEAKRLMDQVRRFGQPLFVLTGGDPLKRPDVVELVEYGAGIGPRMAMTPLQHRRPRSSLRSHDAARHHAPVRVLPCPHRTRAARAAHRDSPLFRALRDRDLLEGKCGVCKYRDICGGSRARAYALTGDYLEAERDVLRPRPARRRRMVETGEAEPVEAYFRRRIVHGWKTPPIRPGS